MVFRRTAVTNYFKKKSDENSKTQLFVLIFVLLNVQNKQYHVNNNNFRF